MAKTIKQSAKPVQQTAKPRHSVVREKDATVKITVVVPWNEVEAVRKEIVDKLAKEITLPGFRKGMAPKEIAAAKLSKEKIQEELLKKILTDEYSKAVKENNIQPIVNPRIHIEAFEDGTNLEFMAETCEEPKIELKNYKEEVKKLTAKSKIVIPGKDVEKVGLEKIVDVLLSTVEGTIPSVLVEQETNRLISNLLDELKRMGVSLDQYLASRSKNADELRKEYSHQAERDLKLEVVLRKIADEEKITVEQPDVETALGSLKDEDSRKEVLKNPYYLAAIIRQQKALDFLSKL